MTRWTLATLALLAPALAACGGGGASQPTDDLPAPDDGDGSVSGRGAAAGGATAGGGRGGTAGADGTGGSGGGPGRDAGVPSQSPSDARSGAPAADARTADSAGGGAPDAPAGPSSADFSFFVTSKAGLYALAPNKTLGFGGNLGGIEGADRICQTLADANGGAGKRWRAFLSATKGGPNGGPIHAIERIGNGPWYDRAGRLIAKDRAALINPSTGRPMGDPQAVNNMANETGAPNRIGMEDNHDTPTGSDKQGRLAETRGRTCSDWTSTTVSEAPMIGHTWPRRGGTADFGAHWISDHPAPGCAAGFVLDSGGSGGPENSVGGLGGYGAIYCFVERP